VALVAGEAGVGKSTLVAEFTRRHTSNSYVLAGRCDPLVTPRALGPLHDIGRHVGGRIAELLAESESQEKIFAASLDLLSGSHHRLRTVLILEDAHWADQATLDWLSFVGRRIDRLPVLLIVTFRDDEVGAGHPLRRTLASFPNTAVQRISVPPLSRACVAKQAELAGHDPDAIYRLTGGNPLLVTEMLKQAQDDAIPAAAQDLILDRIHALPPSARMLAELVAIVPTRAEIALLPGPVDMVQTCVDAGVLVAAGDDGIAFRHELLRSAVEQSLQPAQRRSLHRRVLASLMRLDDVDPGRVVHHARLGGDATAVLRYGRIAGEGAARQGAHREAAAHFRAALNHRDALPPEEQAGLLEAYAREAYLCGFAAEGTRALQDALALRETLGHDDKIVENLRWMSRLSWWDGDLSEAWNHANHAVKVGEESGSPKQQLAIYANLSHLSLMTLRLEEAVEWGERAREHAERLGDLDTMLHATINLQSARLSMGEADAKVSLLQAHDRAKAAGLTEHGARALSRIVNALGDLHEFDAAAPFADQALAYTRDHNLDGYSQVILGYRANIRFAAGNWAGALTDAAMALSGPSPSGEAIRFPLVVRANILSAQGHRDALADLDQAAQMAENMSIGQQLSVSAARSFYYLLNSESDAARQEARRGLELALALPQPMPFWLGQFAYRLWLAGALDDIPKNAAAPYQMMILGNWAEAASEWERRGATYLRAEALSSGDQAAATRALQIFDALGASRAAAMLRAQMRKRGFVGIPRGPNRATAANASGLTPRQMEVLAMLAEGLSNADIAVRLSLSTKTVANHVADIFDKLAVANRNQAVAMARRLNILR
jgi:DNA-binding CsgD family transcriptional regulator/tetratricopeptide (TPR) repeat protein